MFQNLSEANCRSLSLPSRETEQLKGLLHQAENLVVEGKIPEALEVFLATLAVVEQTPFKGTEVHRSVLKTVGDLSFATGNYAEAEKNLVRYLALDPVSLESAKARATLAKVYFSVGKFGQTLILVEHAIDIASRATGRDYDPTLLANALWLEALTYRERGSIERAAESCLEAVDILAEVYGPVHTRTLLCECTLYNLAMLRGDLADAAVHLPRILKDLRTILPSDDLDLVTPLSVNARLACALAKEVRRMRRTCMERQEPQNKGAVLETLGSYGLRSIASHMLRECGEWVPNSSLKSAMVSLERKLLNRAKVHFAEALEISRAGLGDYHPENAELLDKLSVLSDRLGQENESRRYQDEAVKLREHNRSRTEF